MPNIEQRRWPLRVAVRRDLDAWEGRVVARWKGRSLSELSTRRKDLAEIETLQGSD